MPFEILSHSFPRGMQASPAQQAGGGLQTVPRIAGNRAPSTHAGCGNFPSTRNSSQEKIFGAPGTCAGLKAT